MSGPLPVDAQLQAGQRIQPVGVAAVLADQHLRPELAQQRRDDRVEGAQPAGIPGPAGSATLTADPSAPAPPLSAGRPVKGNKVAGCWCRLIVSTRGSDQNAACTPSPWCALMSTYATRSAPCPSSQAIATAAL